MSQRRRRIHLMAMSSAASRISHNGRVLSRPVTFQFALDPNELQRILLFQCAGARRFTFTHHLTRVKANRDLRSAERQSLAEGPRTGYPTQWISWSTFSFITEFSSW